MNYIQISIQAKELQQEILIGKLSQLAATGFEQTDTGLIAYFEEEHFNSYEVNTVIKDLLFTISIIKEQNWNALWESNFEPVIVADFCGIRAHFHEQIKNVAHEIIITPKMSFGTGHHATTFMMIEEMSQLNFKNKTVLDFGTGTGILSILAEKLGAANIAAIDNDAWSIDNAKENLERNNCKKTELQLSSIIPFQSFDIILANINKNVILENREKLKKACNKKTTILLSGLLSEDEKEVVKVFEENDFKLIKKSMKANWICLVFQLH
jgi:ribosomal protein L11 methyltransferase